MPRIYADAPELITSPDGTWAAALSRARIFLYPLESTPESSLADLSARPKLVDDERPALSEAYATLETTGASGRISFIGSDRLLHVFVESSATEEGAETAVVAAELLSVPDLRPIGPLVRVGGVQRIVAVGSAGAVVAPHGPGADIICLRGNELILQRTFMRSEVRSAIPGPERRFLLEQRGGYDVWDVQTRSTVTRLVLQTRQPPNQIGYAQAGKMLWALAAGPPIHLEIFRASDGRRVMEMAQPGRAIAADSAPARLVIAGEERTGLAFFDIDLTTGGLQHYAAPTGYGTLASFALRSRVSSPELLLLYDGDHEDAEVGLLRLRLPIAQQRAVLDELPPAPPIRGTRSPARSPVAIANEAADITSPPPRARLGRSDLRPPRPRAGSDERPPRPATSPDDRGSRQLPSSPQLPSVILSPELSQALTPEDDGEPGIVQMPLFPPGDAAASGSGRIRAARRRRFNDMLGRSYEASQNSATWHWELLRWAQLSIDAAEEQVPLPPDGGPLQALASRLRLTPVTQKILCLLFAGEYLLGSRPNGMRVLEIAACLSSIYEEPTVLAELIPNAPLRTLRLLVARRDGRLRLQPELGRLLMGQPCPDLLPAGGAEREVLAPGLYGYVGPFSRICSVLLRQPALRVDALSETQPLVAIQRAIERALLYDTVVLIDGIAGLSYPAFSTLSLLSTLRPLLSNLRVPVIACSMPDTLAVLGLSTRNLPLGAIVELAGASAPLVPSAPLPAGTTWRGPLLPVSASFLDGHGQTGRIELAPAADRRSAIVIGPSATPEAYATAAYLAARDGAVLALDAELSQVRALVLAMLLRQIPVTVTATPAGSASSLGSGAPPAWPAVLAPFAAP
jgi:hypothetical protein